MVNIQATDSSAFTALIREVDANTRQFLHVVYKIKPPRVLKSLQMWSRILYLPKCTFTQLFNENPLSKSWHWGTMRLNQSYVPPAKQTSASMFIISVTIVFSKESNKFFSKPVKLKLKFIEVLNLMNILNTMQSRNNTVNH